MAINLGSAYGKVSLDVTGIRNGVAQGVSAFREMHSKMMTIGQSFQQIGGIMTAAFTVPIVLAGKKGFRCIQEL